MTATDLPSPAATEIAFRAATMRVVAWLIAVAATVLAPLVYLSSPNPLETWATAAVAAIGWLAVLLLRRGYVTYMPHLVVYSVLTAGSLQVLAFGSVRTAGGFLFVAAVAGAGIFLGRTALIGSVVYSVTSLGLLTLAEAGGWMKTPNFQVGLKVWLTHATVLSVVAVLVYYSRIRAQLAFASQMEELEHRKRIEQERDRSNERFARIFRTSPSPMLAQSARSGAILDVNPAFERCYGYTRDQMLGRTDTVLWAEPEQRESYLRRLFTDRRAEQEHVTGLRCDGSRFEALISSEMGNDPQDRLIITTVADITARDEAVERLRRSEERFAKAFNFSPMNLSITRLSDGMILEVNRSEDIPQEQSAELLRGRTTLETGAWLSPEARQAFVDRLRRDGRVNAYDSHMRTREGDLVDVRLWAVPIEIDGQECILSSTVNVSEEKRREALLLSVAQGLTGETGPAFFDALTRHAALSLKADVVVVSELQPDQRMHTLSVWKDGQSVPNFIDDPHGTPCEKTLRLSELHVLESGLSAPLPGEGINPGEVAQAYVGQCLHDQDGTPIGVLKALWRQPITVGAEMRALMSIFSGRATAELMRLQREREIQRLHATLEQRVRLRTAELEKLNAELDSFAYSVSHDLKSPLRAIDGFTRLLGEQLQGRLSPDEEQLFDRVLASTRRMSTLIADLLALARVSQGELQLGNINLSDIAEQVMQAEQARQPDRPLSWQIEPGLSCRCDPRLARIVLENLLGNAVKYSRDQPAPMIELRRRPADAAHPGGFTVRDNGVGFDMAYADKLFKPFQRLHGPSEFEGTGIGLATVRRIVERHGGHIEGFARPGQGAEFRFSLTPAARL
ncbi:PAS domain S-box protein [Hydrogenophaga sp. MI9]|uniref:PAS domain-containing sensor histidine kinase n=1 Tax=Hydrogenophaga sp. MI9 TaxID=3453719 RepID=UPI003EEBC171